MAKTVYKKVTITIKDLEESLSIQCIRMKGDDNLSNGDEITVSGELKKLSGVLQFGTGCACVKATADRPATQGEVVSALKELPEGEAFAGGICAVTGTVEVIERQRSEAPQKATLFVGVLSMFVAAVFYLLMTDLTFNNTSSRLIIATLLSFGSAILFFLSANYGEKPAIMYLLKVIGILLAAGFIVYTHLFMSLDTYYLGKLDEFRKAGISGAADLAKTQATMIVTLVLSYVSLVAMVANTVLVAVIKED